MARSPEELESQKGIERTAITLAVLLLGAALIWRFGDASPVVAGVSSMWTLVLSFWFRLDTSSR